MKKTILLIFMLVILSSLVYAFSSSDPDLYIWWKLDETTHFPSNNGICGLTPINAPLVQQPKLGTWSDNVYSVVFNGDNEYLENTSSECKSYISNFNNFSYTIAWWANYTSDGSAQYIWDSVSATGGVDIYYHSGIADILMGGPVGTMCDFSFDPTGMTHAFTEIKVNATNITLYINGTQRGTVCNSVAHGGLTTDNLRIGSRHTASLGFNDAIDEFIIINRALTSAESTDLYENGISAPDTTNPTLSNPICTSCVSGTNNTIDSTPTINVTCTDDIDSCILVRCGNNSGLTFDTAGSGRNATQGTGNTWVCTLPSSDQLSNYYNQQSLYFWGLDNSGNNHSVWNLSIDVMLINTPPTTPTIQFPDQGENYTEVTQINFTSTDTENHSLTYNVYINGTLNVSETSTNVTNWKAGEGYYSMVVSADDGINSSDNSTPTLFKIDNTFPTFSSYENSTEHFQFNITITEDWGLDYYLFSWNESGNWVNDTPVKISGNSVKVVINKTVTFDKVISYRWYANDSAGNMNFSDINTFTSGTTFSKLNGLEANRTYEYETTVAITTNLGYIDVEDDTNRYINQSSPLDYLIDILRINEFNDSTESKNISSGSNATISIDNRTDLYNASFNITGFNSPTDLVIEYGLNITDETGGTFYEHTCYQESANVSTTCGGLDTGSYSCEGVWYSIWGPCENTYDGDWDSSGFHLFTMDAYMYVNYSKPRGALNSSLWLVGDFDIRNLTIDANCWSLEPLRFKVKSGWSPAFTYWSCWNSTDWKLLSTGSSYVIYEEAMWWDISEEIGKSSFPGTLLGNNLYQNKFFYLNILYETLTLVYTTAGSKTIYIDVSNQGNILNRSVYLNFTVTASDLDIGNDFDFKDNFSNNVYINISSLVNISAPNSNLDDLEDLFTNSTDYYTKECSSNPGDDTCDDCEGARQACINRTDGEADDYLLVQSFSKCDSNNCFHSSTVSLTIEKIRLKEISFFNLTADREGGVSGSGGSHSSSISIMATDGTTDKVFWFSSGAIQKGIFLKGNTTNGFDWSLYQNNTLLGTADISSLASPVKLKITVISSTSTDVSGPENANSQIKIYNIDTSGIRLNRNNGSYEINVSEGCFESNTLKVGATNIARVFISLTQDIPSDTTIGYFTSNDNGTNFESFTPDSFHTFTTSDTDLKVKFCLNSTDTSLSPSIFSYRVQIIPAAPSGLIIDVGLDGSDAVFDFELNSTTTPLRYNGTDVGIDAYINRSCRDSLFCSFPITFILGTGGNIEISLVNVTQNINPIRLDVTILQDLNEILISPTYTGGTVQFDDIQADYRGSKNITVYAHNADYTSSLNRTIFVKYSPISVTYWQDFDHYVLKVTSANQSDIEPFFQNSSHGIWKIPSFAYDGNVSVWARHNRSLESCVTKMELRGQDFSAYSYNNASTLNITNLTATNQQIIANMDPSDIGNIRTYTMINCSGSSSRFILGKVCFNSRCSECIETSDFQDNCDVVI